MRAVILKLIGESLFSSRRGSMTKSKEIGKQLLLTLSSKLVVGGVVLGDIIMAAGQIPFRFTNQECFIKIKIKNE